MGNKPRALQESLRGEWAAAAVGAVFVLAVGVAGTAVLLSPSSPKVLEPARDASTAPVTQSTFGDERSVELELTRLPDVSIDAPTGGRITSSTCSVGATATSGASLLSVDGQPALTLATSMPLWRDLARGDTGDDVRALQSELARLGHKVSVDGVMGRSTLSAFQAAFATVGDSHAAPDAANLARIVWIPESSVTIASCDAVAGATVAAGASIAHVAGGLAHASVRELPADLVPGERIVEVAGQRFPVASDGSVDDAELIALNRLVRTNGRLTAEGNPSTSASLELAAPIGIAVVPPSAVFNVIDSKGCVNSGGATLPVTVTGSQLGQTFVTFDDSKPPTSVQIAPKVKTSCR